MDSLRPSGESSRAVLAGSVVGPPCTSGARRSASPYGASERRSNVDHRSAPIEHSREQCEADASGVIHGSGFDTALGITRELLAKNQILCADHAGRAKERDGQPQDVNGYPNECSRQLRHALIMPESLHVCRYRIALAAAAGIIADHNSHRVLAARVFPRVRVPGIDLEPNHGRCSSPPLVRG
jgi:hypothetical protein